MAFQHHDQQDAARETSAGVNLGPLPASVCFALRRAQHMVTDDLVRTLQPLNLRPTYFAVLVVIGENPGLNQSEVSAALGIQRTNFVTIIDHLETRGLVERHPSKEDRRSYALHLTEEGREVLNAARQLQAEHEQRLTQKLGQEGRELLLPLLRRLAA
ncbi:MarR family transcriptional regulator [Chelativorans sp. Marseille-P2723]|uniref:MarR family winged helix-turn-helix transcriptional regulator n=1 Tax=Chelativorans sp. Marseille-P2723 TaxID=2709133 RepID=UPI00156FD842|nr:MarR family transcriptional regulator [Chelativorans sp. Marseille-P2723]